MTDIGEFHTDGKNDFGDDVEAFSSDLRGEEIAEHAAQRTAELLENTGFTEVVDLQFGIGRVHIMTRVKADDEKAFVNQIISPSAFMMEENGIDHWLGKQYFPKAGKLRYGWVFSYGAEDIMEAFRKVADVLSTKLQPAEKHEVNEMFMHGKGAPQSGGLNTGRKGAAAIKA